MLRLVLTQRIVQYVTENGRCPFEEWFSDLKDLMGKSIVAARIEKMRQGLNNNEKSLGEGVFESKIDHGPGYRIYFGRKEKDLVILLIGGTKHRQDHDIKKAKEFWSDYLRRQNGKAI